MRTILRAAARFSVSLSLLVVLSAATDTKPTSLSDAQAAIEANLRTPEGKAFDDRIGNEFSAKHLAPLRQCKSAGNALTNFWMLLKLDKDGAAQEILLYPTTPLGACAREAYLKDKFLPPPRPAYWVGVYLKLSH